MKKNVDTQPVAAFLHATLRLVRDNLLSLRLSKYFARAAVTDGDALKTATFGLGVMRCVGVDVYIWFYIWLCTFGCVS